MLILISELFPLHGTFHLSPSPENHLLSPRTHLERTLALALPGLSLQRL